MNLNKKGFAAAPASVWDPAERLKEQDRDGVAAEVLYTTFGMMLYGLDDAGLRGACFRAYNDFVAEYCSYNTDRLVGVGLVTLEDIDAGVAELKRCADKGLRGAMIWASPPDEQTLWPPRLRSVLGRLSGPEYAPVTPYSDRTGRNRDQFQHIPDLVYVPAGRDSAHPVDHDIRWGV